MTIGAQTPIIKYAYSVPATFSFNFKILKDEDIAVYHLDGGTGISTKLVLNTDYTVNFNVNVQGGDVVLSFNGASGTIEIRRNMAIEQQVDFVNNERLDMEIVERALDRLTMLIQQYLIELQEGTGTSNFRGVWSPNTLYKAGELVTFPGTSGSMYLAANEHTSGTDFSIDLAASNWQLFIDTASLTSILMQAQAAAASASASEASALSSEGLAAASALLASQYGLGSDSVVQSTLTISNDGTETTAITSSEFSTLALVITGMGQVIPWGHVNSIDGPNKTFKLDYVETDLAVLYIKSEPASRGLIVDARTSLEQIIPGVGGATTVLFNEEKIDLLGAFSAGVFTAPEPMAVHIELGWQFTFDSNAFTPKVLDPSLLHELQSGVNYFYSVTNTHLQDTGALDTDKEDKYSVTLNLGTGDKVSLLMQPPFSGKIPADIDIGPGINLFPKTYLMITRI